MPSFEWNKIIGSVLTAMIIAMVTGILASEIVEPTHLKKPVYMPPGAAGGGKEAAAPAAAKPAGPQPIAPFLAKADPKKGEQIATVCKTCHTLNKGEPNRIGPNLFGVAEEKIAAVPNYQFSDALSKHKGERWDPARLNEWLYNPQHFAAGTKMSFPGLPHPQQRADVIAYLETLTPGGLAHEQEIVKKAAAEAAHQKAAAKPASEAKPGEAKEGEAKGGKAAQAGGAPSIAELVAKADPKKGEQIAKVCQICHTLGKGEPNKIGPNLYGVFGGPIAEDRGGYSFSPALSKHKGEKWTVERLNAWLTNPQHFAKGTKMTFPGLPKEQERADVIAYLKTLK